MVKVKNRTKNIQQNLSGTMDARTIQAFLLHPDLFKQKQLLQGNWCEKMEERVLSYSRLLVRKQSNRRFMPNGDSVPAD